MVNCEPIVKAEVKVEVDQNADSDNATDPAAEDDYDINAIQLNGDIKEENGSDNGNESSPSGSRMKSKENVGVEKDSNNSTPPLPATPSRVKREREVEQPGTNRICIRIRQDGPPTQTTSTILRDSPHWTYRALGKTNNFVQTLFSREIGLPFFTRSLSSASNDFHEIRMTRQMMSTRAADEKEGKAMTPDKVKLKQNRRRHQETETVTEWVKLDITKPEKTKVRREER